MLHCPTNFSLSNPGSMRSMREILMKLKTSLPLVFLALFLPGPKPVHAAPKTLDIYFIDVEGGAATLIVTPTGQSLLIDTGFPGDRDAGRIAHAALEIAGLKQIDHCVITHWHRDHVGGVATLSKLIPIKNDYDHGLPQTIASDMQEGVIDADRATEAEKAVRVKR